MAKQNSLPLVDIAIAPCTQALPVPGESNLIEIQVLPAGKFGPQDGRPMDVPHWYIDTALATALIARVKGRKTRPVIDYEHQTLHKEKNGQPAPAAAWINDLEWREGSGLWATVELTQRAHDQIAAKEYLYFSPVFAFDKRTGDVLDLKLGAFTNLPGIDGLEPLTVQAAATFALDIAALTQTLSSDQPNQEQDMDELLEQLRWLLNLPVGATADDVKAQLQKLITQLGGEQGTAAASADIGALLSSKDTQIAALSAQVGTPDPAKFVPISIMLDLQGQVAALTAQVNESKVADLVDVALSDGRLLPAQEDWARGLGKTNLAALTAYLDTAPKIAALSGIQTGGKAPETSQAKPDEALQAVCSMFGNDLAAVQQTLNQEQQ